MKYKTTLLIAFLILSMLPVFGESWGSNGDWKTMGEFEIDYRKRTYNINTISVERPNRNLEYEDLLEDETITFNFPAENPQIEIVLWCLHDEYGWFSYKVVITNTAVHVNTSVKGEPITNVHTFNMTGEKNVELRLDDDSVEFIINDESYEHEQEVNSEYRFSFACSPGSVIRDLKIR